MSDDVKVPSDTELLDFYEKNNACFLSLGKYWYVKKSYQQPFRRCNSLREAIILGIRLNTQENTATQNPVMFTNLCKEANGPVDVSKLTRPLGIVS